MALSRTYIYVADSPRLWSPAAPVQHPPTLTVPANSFCPPPRICRFRPSFLPPEVKRATNAAVAFIIKSCAPPWSRRTSAVPRSWRRNGRSRSKWTEELSCVLNSLLLSLGPVAIAHQTASLFSSGEEEQVCDELVTKSLYVQINSALCGSAAEMTSFSEKKKDGCWLFTEFGNIWSWTSTLWWRARIKTCLSSPERPPSHIHETIKVQQHCFGITRYLHFRSQMNYGLFLVPERCASFA